MGKITFTAEIQFSNAAEVKSAIVPTLKEAEELAQPSLTPTEATSSLQLPSAPGIRLIPANPSPDRPVGAVTEIVCTHDASLMNLCHGTLRTVGSEGTVVEVAPEALWSKGPLILAR